MGQVLQAPIAIRLEAIASRLEGIASRLEGIASRLEAIAYVMSHSSLSSRAQGDRRCSADDHVLQKGGLFDVDHGVNHFSTTTRQWENFALFDSLTWFVPRV